ncbi:sugar phosphate isomerase/epimerase family protein [Chryseolinea lacunae]|uniref:Sugar phosphate isomerase/epimerase n=1 Tax=Chryseolinea lacunae TaxID=2801331 RepID=A0ABS1KWQ0_9BACT|nr:sugar phosphate isomerase/epimerase family protein [Chryseolinea lacunae]MBL0743898.1 sugar phosphate isomerase/epimerase [Chryseolinea lacunae]
MTTRRDALRTLGLLTGAAALAPQLAFSKPEKKTTGTFKFCLNTSTISGQKPGLQKYIDIAARAGYDSLELWVQDVKAFKDSGNSLKTLKKVLDDSHLTVEDAIGFAPWMVDDDAQRKQGFAQMKEEMLMMAELGCKRIAAPSSGVKSDTTLDLYKVGERYKALLDLGRETGVMPLLEFWGSSPVFYHFGQALMAAAAANDPDARILPDVYHLFRGGSGFDCLKMVSGHLIDVIHLNDYPGNIARTEQKDSHRVYPGDGVAPLKQILTDLANMGGTKVLSLELFNGDYWKQDALVVAKTGLEKMRKAVALI